MMRDRLDAAGQPQPSGDTPRHHPNMPGKAHVLPHPGTPAPKPIPPPPPLASTYHVLMDVNRWDTDEGRAWITVEATGHEQAKQKVRELYPNAAVLRAEDTDGR